MEGKICIARYGGSYRGVKVKVADDNGAVGLILYSDPTDDGYMRGNVYPRGPWRSEDAIQRGTVKYIFQHASDPLTPGWAATKDAERLPMAEATDLPKIPVVSDRLSGCQTVSESTRGTECPISLARGSPFRLSYRTGPRQGSP